MIRVGESSCLLEFATLGGPLVALRDLRGRPLPDVVELVPGARTLLVSFARAVSARDQARLFAAERAAAQASEAPESAATLHTIPVRYDGADLADLARHAGVSVAQAIALHASVEYRVAFLGFQPGFAYLAGLAAALTMPRRASPRPRVPAGSVAIGAEWTGIYPAATPGGWNLLGTTEVRLFDATASPPALLLPGDRVRFVPR
ncbi:MAG TPA: 5-oxoprolinase subunit PxpB [Candidatus Bathyarchaeia archaeon]|nr:5-oxoprolinase subunit PxpB [Candidatus Bathyarchaeia archaeon]